MILKKGDEPMLINKKKVMLLLAERGMLYKDICSKAGISEVEFRKIRAGERNPKPATIGKIASALDVGVQEIIVQEGDDD